MKIISISPYNFFQKNSGVNTRIYYISKYLDTNYTTIHIIRNENFTKKGAVGFKGDIFLGGKNKFSHLLSFKVIKKITKENKENNIIIFCHTLWGGIYGLFFKKIFGINYVFDNHNVEYLRFKRTGNKIWRVVRVIEKYIIRSANNTYVCSENDKDYILKNLTTANIKVVPNGVSIIPELIASESEIRQRIRLRHKIGVHDKLLLFSGNFDYKPNIQALNYIKENIIPFMPEGYKMVICGGNFKKYFIDHPSVVFTGNVNNILEYNIASDLLIAPLFSGSGTKLKILEALGYGLTTVTTKIGAEGIINNQNLFVIDKITIEDIEKILLKQTIGKKIDESYSWESSLDKIEIIKGK